MKSAEVLPNLMVGAELVMKIAEACALADRPLVTDELVRYSRKNKRSSTEAIKGAQWAGLIEFQDGKYVASSLVVRSDFPADEKRMAVLFLKFLRHKKSFVQFSTFLDIGNDPLDAAEKVQVLYRIDGPPETVLELFGGWGRSAGVLEGSNRSLRLKPEFHTSDLPFDYLEGLKDALENDMKARVFINKKLSEDTFEFLPIAGIDRMVTAMRSVVQDARNSVEDAGEVLEDFLRLKAAKHGISDAESSGIGGVLNVLEKHMASDSAISSEHKIIGEALNTLRIMSAHPTRAKTGLRWEMKSDSGLEAILLVLSLMRSIDEYDRTKIAIF